MTTKAISRRNALKAAGVTLAAGVVACSGLGYAASRTPDIDTPKIILGKENLMSKRVLVAYATRAGSTVEVATAIAESLAGRGYAVDVKPFKDKPDLAGYQAVILGSAIRMGSWLPEAVDFVKANQQTLSQLPVALFTVHMLNTGDDETSRANRYAYLKDVRPLVKSVGEAYFAGKMDFSRLSFLDRFIANMVKAVESDQRNWQEIHGWAASIFA